jgi:hypothetical protein
MNYHYFYISECLNKKSNNDPVYFKPSEAFAPSFEEQEPSHVSFASNLSKNESDSGKN